MHLEINRKTITTNKNPHTKSKNMTVKRIIPTTSEKTFKVTNKTNANKIDPYFQIYPYCQSKPAIRNMST